MDSGEKFAMRTKGNYSYTGNTGSCSSSCCTVGLAQGSVTECNDVSVNSVEALMTALALPPVDPLDLTNSVTRNHMFGNPNNLEPTESVDTSFGELHDDVAEAAGNSPALRLVGTTGSGADRYAPESAV